MICGDSCELTVTRGHMRRPMRRATTFLAGSLALSTFACGGETRSTVLLNGAGATFPYIIYSDWIRTYAATNAQVQVNYQSIGSGGGIRQFSDGTVDFGGTDAPMTDSAIAGIGGNVIHLPTVLGAVVPIYNLAGLGQPIRFTPELLSDIFLGKLTTWNDPRIASVNPGVTLPAEEIVVVHRSDGSGTSFVWTDYLSKVSADWVSHVGRGTSVNWPTGLGGKGNEGVSATVQQTPGAVGYVELGYALPNRDKIAIGHVRNRAGNFIEPTIAAITAAAAGAMEEMGPQTDFRVSITDSPGADAWPISSFTWILLHRDYEDAAKAGELVKFLWWAVTDGQAAAPALGYAPLPTAMVPWIETRLHTVSAGGAAVWPVGSGAP